MWQAQMAEKNAREEAKAAKKAQREQKRAELNANIAAQGPNYRFSGGLSNKTLTEYQAIARALNLSFPSSTHLRTNKHDMAM